MEAGETSRGGNDSGSSPSPGRAADALGKIERTLDAVKFLGGVINAADGSNHADVAFLWMRVVISGLKTAVRSLRELARVRREQADQVCFPATVTAPYLATEPNARQVKSELDQRRVQRPKSRADAKWESRLHSRATPPSCPPSSRQGRRSMCRTRGV